MRFIPSQISPVVNFSITHSCVDWGALDGWAEARHIPNFQSPGYLQHPVLGDVFGKNFDYLGSLIGVAQDRKQAEVSV